MLVLTRKPAQSVIIPTAGITITVLEIEGGRARLGIAAPPDLPILRAELFSQGTEEAEPLPLRASGDARS